MSSGAAHRGQPTLSQSDYFQRAHQAASASSGQCRQVTFRQVPDQASCIQGSNPSTQIYGTRPSTAVQQRLVKLTPDFNDLFKPEEFEKMERASARFGRRYDGRQHSQYAISVKKYISGCIQPLNQYQLNQLIPLLQTYKPAPGWSFRSLATVLHSFTSAVVFKPRKHTDQAVKDIQAALLEAFLKAVSDKCSQTPIAKDIDARGIANLLWAMAKLGELISTGAVVSTSVTLVHEFGEYSQFTQQELLMALWGLLACSARLYFDGNADGNDILQQSINKLFTHVQNKPMDRVSDKSTMAQAACWLGVRCPVSG